MISRMRATRRGCLKGCITLLKALCQAVVSGNERDGGGRRGIIRGDGVDQSI